MTKPCIATGFAAAAVLVLAAVVSGCSSRGGAVATQVVAQAPLQHQSHVAPAPTGKPFPWAVPGVKKYRFFVEDSEDGATGDLVDQKEHAELINRSADCSGNYVGGDEP
jgi:hypothetical protein